MFILYALPAGLLAGLALGGRLEGLSRIKFRGAWVFLVGLAVQLVLFSDQVTGWIGSLGPPVYVVSTAAVALVIAANWRITGMPVVLVGAISNLAAIVANGGYMPASAGALAAFGRPLKDGYSNSAFVVEPQLAFITDIFAMPAWMPWANVFSVGDVLIGAGVALVIVAAMRSTPGERLAVAATTPDPTPAD
jgi:uncharacterized protein DUF5317